MSPKSERSLKKMTVRFYEDDLTLLREVYPGTGYNEIVRALISKHCKKIRNATAEYLQDKLTPAELKAL